MTTRNNNNSRTYTDDDNIEHTEFESENYQRDLELALAQRQKPRSCLECSHFPVCFLYRNEVGLLQSQYAELNKKDWPNLPEDRAWICKYYEQKKHQGEIEPETRSSLSV